jgi:hypothetical protein
MSDARAQAEAVRQRAGSPSGAGARPAAEAGVRLRDWRAVRGAARGAAHARTEDDVRARASHLARGDMADAVEGRASDHGDLARHRGHIGKGEAREDVVPRPPVEHQRHADRQRKRAPQND